MPYHLKNGKNTFFFQNSPYKVHFNKGKYFVELFGASGGGIDGGHGGYSSGTLVLKEYTTLYLYIGGKGECNCDKENIFLIGGWNGGGNASSHVYQSSGGGGTDIRLSENNNYEGRIIVAGGGGGSGDGCWKEDRYKYAGGNGGVLVGGTSYGFSGYHDISYGNLYSYGGNQTNGGFSKKHNDNSDNEDGNFGEGGTCVGGTHYCGAGGGGYFGGGGGFDVTGGGGGSRYINYDYFIDGMTNSSNYTGDGKIFITTLGNINICHCKSYFSTYMILIMIVKTKSG